MSLKNLIVNFMISLIMKIKLVNTHPDKTLLVRLHQYDNRNVLRGYKFEKVLDPFSLTKIISVKRFLTKNKDNMQNGIFLTVYEKNGSEFEKISLKPKPKFKNQTSNEYRQRQFKYEDKMSAIDLFLVAESSNLKVVKFVKGPTGES